MTKHSMNLSVQTTVTTHSTCWRTPAWMYQQWADGGRLENCNISPNPTHNPGMSSLICKCWKMVSHLAEAFFDGAEVWKNVIPHHRVFLALHPDHRAHRTTISQRTTYAWQTVVWDQTKSFITSCVCEIQMAHVNICEGNFEHTVWASQLPVDGCVNSGQSLAGCFLLKGFMLNC